jgi:alkylhydroperoxidase family enzyme
VAADGPAPSVRVPPASARSLRPLARITARVTARATQGERPRLFTTLGRHPRLFRAWLRFSATLLLRGDLAPADRELVIMRTAWRCGSWYEWAQHGALPPRRRLAVRDIERITEGPDAAGWRPRQRLLLEAADELHDHRVIADRTWEALATQLTERQLIELCLLVGHYQMLAMTLNSLGVEPEPTTLARLSGGAGEAAAQLRAGLVAARGGDAEAVGSTEPSPTS